MPDENIPSTPRAHVCNDCGHHPHRHADPGRDKVCPICGCPDLRGAKRERDADSMRAHGDAKRPATGFA